MEGSPTPAVTEVRDVVETPRGDTAAVAETLQNLRDDALENHVKQLRVKRDRLAKTTEAARLEEEIRGFQQQEVDTRSRNEMGDEVKANLKISKQLLVAAAVQEHEKRSSQFELYAEQAALLADGGLVVFEPNSRSDRGGKMGTVPSRVTFNLGIGMYSKDLSSKVPQHYRTKIVREPSLESIIFALEGIQKVTWSHGLSEELMLGLVAEIFSPVDVIHNAFESHSIGTVKQFLDLLAQTVDTGNDQYFCAGRGAAEMDWATHVPGIS